MEASDATALLQRMLALNSRNLCAQFVSLISIVPLENGWATALEPGPCKSTANIYPSSTGFG